MLDPAKKMSTFGARLRAARKKTGLPQDQLGLDLGVTKGAISAWENGRAAPSFALLPDIREAVHMSLDELICGDGNPDAAPRAPLPPAPGKADPAEAELLRRFRSLPKIKRTALLELMR